MVTHDLHGAITKFSRMNSPLIVAVNGVAAGAGLSFVGFADLAIAKSSAPFVSAYTKAGLTPDGSSSYYLPRIIGIRKYLELVMTNKVLSSEDALSWGLLNYVHDDKNFWDETIKLADVLSKVQNNKNKFLKYFIQVNIGNEIQKSGISISELDAVGM